MKHILLQEYYEMMSALSVIQHLNPSCRVYEWMSVTTPWYFFPFWNLNVCEDQSHAAGGRGGAIRRKPQTIQAAVPLPLSCNLHHDQTTISATEKLHQGAGVLRSVFFPSLMTFSFLAVRLFAQNKCRYAHACTNAYINRTQYAYLYKY